MANHIYKEYRCICNKLLFRGADLLSYIEIKCKRCNSLMYFNPIIPNKLNASSVVMGSIKTINSESDDVEGVLSDL